MIRGLYWLLLGCLLIPACVTDESDPEVPELYDSGAGGQDATAGAAGASAGAAGQGGANAG